ncbi:hypothetical protein SAY87_023905 [Trapa incisa]|uniref:DEAD-box ATP-dependent RNA helicase 48 n=1 Tax=Trapa incisa TaxID=236973 RepID=A0AAN7L1E6_9MYRT|nr:hypothetical protein SAY87_023905 [Trapa incisa]
MAIFPQIALSQPLCHSHLSFSSTLISPSDHRLFIPPKTDVVPLLLRPSNIRMGGGPRTFPGGVSKWQWKRMQAKKAKQLLKARLTRERQIYEMRKRAELRAAVSELERPWEAVGKAPALFSVGADEQLKVLADRFQRPGGFDMWTDRDGPELFKTVDALPSARFFPKGVVHSVKPYGRLPKSEGSIESSSSGGESELGLDSESETASVVGKQNSGYRRNKRNSNRRMNPKSRVIGDNQLGDHMDGSISTLGSENDVEPDEQVIENGDRRNSKGGRMRGRNAYISKDHSRSPTLDSKNGGQSEGRSVNGGKSVARSVKKMNTRGSSQVGFDRKQRGLGYGGHFRSGKTDRMKDTGDLDAKFHDLNLQDDGSYGL